MAKMHTLLALDFDETLVPSYQFVVPVWHAFMANWLVQHGLYQSVAEARNNLPALDKNPNSCTTTTLAKTFGKNKAWIDAFYQSAAPLALAACRQGGLQPTANLKAQLTTLNSQGYQPVIISQGHRDYILPLLHDWALEKLIPPHWVIDRAHKRLEPHGYQLAKHLTNHLGLGRFIMTDDTAVNFAHAKAEGYHTVLIKPEPTVDELTLADQHAPDLSCYLETLINKA